MTLSSVAASCGDTRFVAGDNGAAGATLPQFTSYLNAAGDHVVSYDGATLSNHSVLAHVDGLSLIRVAVLGVCSYIVHEYGAPTVRLPVNNNLCCAVAAGRIFWCQNAGAPRIIHQLFRDCSTGASNNLFCVGTVDAPIDGLQAVGNDYLLATSTRGDLYLFRIPGNAHDPLVNVLTLGMGRETSSVHSVRVDGAIFSAAVVFPDGSERKVVTDLKA